MTDGTRVAVQFARQVTFTVDGEKKTFWTTATSLDQALAALGVNTTGADLSTSRSASIGREGLAVDVDTLKTVTVDAAGKKRQVKTTGTTVADVLAAPGSTPTATTSSAPTPTPGRRRRGQPDLDQGRRQQGDQEAGRRLQTVRQESGRCYAGTTKVDTAGEEGTRTLTYRVVRRTAR